MGPIERLIENVIAGIETGNRSIIWGESGVGKTSMLQKIADRLGRKLVTIIPALCDPTDINGFPLPNRDRRVGGKGGDHPVIEFAPRRSLVELSEHPGGGILLFDEITGGSTAVQSALLRTMIDGVAGEYELGDNVAIVAAANPPELAVNGQELGAPMVNRLDHYVFPSHIGEGADRRVNPEAVVEWCDNVVGWWGNLGRLWSAGTRGAVTDTHLIRALQLVSEFLRRRQELWHRPDETGMAGWPSPRSWGRVAKYIAHAAARNRPVVTTLDRIVAAVGSAAAVEFQQFADKTDLPDPEAVLADPAGWKFSGRVDLDYAVMLSVVAAVQARPTADRVLSAFKVALRSTDRSGGPVKEAAMVAVRPLVDLVQTGHPAYKQIVKGLSAADRTEFHHNIDKATAKFSDLVKVMRE